MLPLKNVNVNGELITIQQGCEITNLGECTVRKLVKESGAGIKIGRSYRINRKVFLNYICTRYSE